VAIRIRIRIATLLRRALAEVCTVSVLLVDIDLLVYLDAVEVKFEVLGQSSRLQDENVAKVVGATSSEGLFVNAVKMIYFLLFGGLLHQSSDTIQDGGDGVYLYPPVLTFVCLIFIVNRHGCCQR